MRIVAAFAIALAVTTTVAGQSLYRISWPEGIITYPTPLSTANVLNATSSVPGTFVYDPPAGTVLEVGHRSICETFTPTDPTYPTSQACTDVWVDLTTPSSTPSVVAAPFAVGGGALAQYLAFDDSGRIFVANQLDSLGIEVRDQQSLALLNTVYSPSVPGFTSSVLDIGRHRLYAIDKSTVQTLDTTTLNWIETTNLLDGNTEDDRILVEDPGAGRLYVYRPHGNLLTIDLSKAVTDPARVAALPPIPAGSTSEGVAVDESAHLLYIASGPVDNQHNLLTIIDGDPGNPATFLTVLKTTPLPALGSGNMLSIAVDRASHRVYVGVGEGIEIIDGDRTSATFGSVVDKITNLDLALDDLGDGTWNHVLGIDPDRQRLYDWISAFWLPTRPLLATIDLPTKTMVSRTGFADSYGGDFDSFEFPWTQGRIQVSPFDHRVFVLDGDYQESAVAVVTDEVSSSASTSAAAPGQPVSVSLAAVSVTFASVAATGTTAATTVDPSSLNLSLPGAFALQGSGFELTTTASVGSPIVLCFRASTVTDPIAFAGLHVMHGEGGTWVDRTSSRDYASGQVCATVTSLSPFAIARQTQPAHSLLALFDQTKAAKLGSTVPIKIRVNNLDGTNASNPDLVVKVLELTRVSNQAPGLLTDAGNANPDATFRYEASLAGYIYNLQTAPLASGTWEMTLGIGLDSTTYTVRFQIK